MAKRRSDFEENHEKLAKAFFAHIKADGRMPTNVQLCKDTGLSSTTVTKHFDKLSGISLDARIRGFKLLAETVMASLAIQSQEGDVQAAKLFMQIVEKFSERTEHEHSGEFSWSGLTPEELKSNIADIKSRTG